MRLLPALVFAALLLLPACDSDDEEESADLGSYSAAFGGAYTADVEGVALFADIDLFPLPPVGSEEDQPDYSLQFGPRPETGPAGVPNVQFFLTQDDLDARALVFTPPPDGLPLLLNATLITEAFSPSGLWNADSGRVAFDAVGETRVTGTFDVRFTRIERTSTEEPVQRLYTTATGTFEAAVVDAP